MSNIELKLKENRNRRVRENYLVAVDPELRSFLVGASFSSDVSCLRYAAFSTWNQRTNQQTTTRGDIEGWRNYTFSSWSELVDRIKSYSARVHVDGWFFVSTDGPYYSMPLADFILLSDNIARQSEICESYDFGWVGTHTDCGIIAEFNHTSFCRNEFELSVWGI